MEVKMSIKHAEDLAARILMTLDESVCVKLRELKPQLEELRSYFKEMGRSADGSQVVEPGKNSAQGSYTEVTWRYGCYCRGEKVLLSGWSKRKKLPLWSGKRIPASRQKRKRRWKKVATRRQSEVAPTGLLTMWPPTM